MPAMMFLVSFRERDRADHARFIQRAGRSDHGVRDRKSHRSGLSAIARGNAFRAPVRARYGLAGLHVVAANSAAVPSEFTCGCRSWSLKRGGIQTFSAVPD